MVFSDLNIIKWGISPDLPFETDLRIRMVNLFSLMAAIGSFPYIFIYHKLSTGLSLISLFAFIGFIVTWWINKYKYFYAAKIWLYIFANLFLFVSASSFGRESGDHLVLIPVLFGSVLVFEVREKLSLIIAILFVSVNFIVLEITDYSLFKVVISPEQQLEYYYGNLFITVVSSSIIAFFYFNLYGKLLYQKESIIRTSQEIENTIQYFSTSLFGKNSVDEILWDVVKNCIGRMGFVDCVIYLLDDDRQVLVQKAAYGTKNPVDYEIFHPIEIPVGKGIVGHVAQSGKYEIVPDTSKDLRYITDDAIRLSEIAVPLIYQNKVIGVIDSEHPERNYFNEHHLDLFKTISSLCANKVAGALAEEQRVKTLKIQLEAEKIKNIDDLRKRLFTNIPHELRTPLTLIMGTLDLYRHSDTPPDWDMLKDHTNRLVRLINQLLDLTKLESGVFYLTPRPGDIMAFLRMMTAQFDSLGISRHIHIEDNIPDEALWLNYDRDALEKIFYNLLSNAVKFTRDYSTVFLEVEYDQNLWVYISDHGPGISEDDQGRIFQRFYRADPDQSTGMGIGLAITRELIDLHQGRISLESKTGKGATFGVMLPLSLAPPPDQIDKIPDVVHIGTNMGVSSSLQDKETILLIEDNPEVSELVASLLDPTYQVICVYEGESGLKVAQTNIPDLIICDIMMPGISGLEVCRSLKAHELTNHIPIILLTAKAEFENKLEGLETGADDYLIKPFDADELSIRIRNLMNQRNLLRKKYRKIIELQPSEVVITNAEELFIKNMISLVDENMDNSEFEVSDICIKLGMSRMQLHRKLTALTNQSATAFVRTMRLQRAAYLLENGEMVSQVAYSVGYSSLSTFSRIFKEKYGVSPSEYGK